MTSNAPSRKPHPDYCNVLAAIQSVTASSARTRPSVLPCAS
jgi:hypothetical protein